MCRNNFISATGGAFGIIESLTACARLSAKITWRDAGVSSGKKICPVAEIAKLVLIDAA